MYVLLAALSVWLAYDYTRPVERYVVRTTVQADETLWKIVGEEMAKAGDRRDIRKVIWETQNLSGLDRHKSLQVGDILLIPLEAVK